MPKSRKAPKSTPIDPPELDVLVRPELMLLAEALWRARWQHLMARKDVRVTWEGVAEQNRVYYTEQASRFLRAANAVGITIIIPPIHVDTETTNATQEGVAPTAIQ